MKIYVLSQCNSEVLLKPYESQIFVSNWTLGNEENFNLTVLSNDCATLSSLSCKCCTLICYLLDNGDWVPLAVNKCKLCLKLQIVGMLIEFSVVVEWNPYYDFTNCWSFLKGSCKSLTLFWLYEVYLLHGWV